MSHRALTDDGWRDWHRRYLDDGLALTAIAKLAGVTKDTVTRAFKRLGLRIRTRGEASRARRRHDYSRIREMHQAGMTLTAISRELDIPLSTVGWIIAPPPRRVAPRDDPQQAARYQQQRRADHALRARWDAERARITADRKKREEQARWR